MSNPKIRYGSSYYTFDTIVRPNYPNNFGIQYHTDLLQNPEYGITNRDLPETNITWEVSGIQKTARDLFWTLWHTTLNHGNYMFTLIDNKKRMLFDVFWPQWKERWQKQRGGIYVETLDMASAYPWTPPLFAFYPFTAANASGYGCHSLDSASTLSVGSGGSLSSQTLILTEQVAAAVAASKTGMSWFQQKCDSSISLIAKFRCGELTAGAQLDIIKITDGNNILRLYITNIDESSSVGLSSSVGISSSSSIGLSSSSSMGLSSSIGISSSSFAASVSSSSSIGLSSSVGLSSSSIGISSSSMNLSSSSMNVSSSSIGLSSSSSQGLSSSSSQGLSSSLGLSSSQGFSSVGSSYSSPSTSSQSASSSSSVGLSSSSSDAAYSSSSVESSALMKICFEWTKSGSASEYIYQEDISINSEGARCWYDICGTFDNVNNHFHLYIRKSGDITKEWSYTFNFLYTPIPITTPDNSITSELSPTNYPEDVTWSAIYLLNGSTANLYVDNAEKAELKYAMIVDDFITPIEYNWIRRLFHYWNKSGATYPL